MFQTKKLECIKLDNLFSLVNICGLGLDSALRVRHNMVLHSTTLTHKNYTKLVRKNTPAYFDALPITKKYFDEIDKHIAIRAFFIHY